MKGVCSIPSSARSRVKLRKLLLPRLLRAAPDPSSGHPATRRGSLCSEENGGWELSRDSGSIRDFVSSFMGKKNPANVKIPSCSHTVCFSLGVTINRCD